MVLMLQSLRILGTFVRLPLQLRPDKRSDPCRIYSAERLELHAET
jgi:hypothetical protein